MSDLTARKPTKATVRNVIIRGCAACGHGRQRGVPCGGCGNPLPPEVIDLGIQSAYYRNPLKRWAWLLAGRHLAARRAHRANASREEAASRRPSS